jgi:hypothetical protein
MPARVIDLLASWMGGFGKCHSALVWGAIPYSVMGVIWCERYTQVFEGQEVMSIEIKSRFLKILYEWVSITTGLGFSSFDDFLDSCTLS